MFLGFSTSDLILLLLKIYIQKQKLAAKRRRMTTSILLLRVSTFSSHITLHNSVMHNSVSQSHSATYAAIVLLLSSFQPLPKSLYLCLLKLPPTPALCPLPSQPVPLSPIHPQDMQTPTPAPPTFEQPQPPPRISLQEKAKQKEQGAESVGYERPNAREEDPAYQQLVGLPPELGDDDGEDAEYEQPTDHNAEYERA